MMFLHLPRFSWWFGSYKITKTMVDFQVNLERWLEDVTLFQAEPVDDQFNFDELLGTGKAIDEVSQAIPGLTDLGWLDEKVDLSVFDNPNNLLVQPNDAETLMIEDAANLLGFMDSSNFDTSHLSSEHLKIDTDFLQDFQVLDFEPSATSPEVPESHLASPGVTSLQVNSPYFYPSPVSSPILANTITESNSDSSRTPPSPVSPWPAYEESLSSPTNGVVVTVCEKIVPNSPQDDSEVEAASLEEISKCVKAKKYVNNGKEVPKIRILMKDPFHPYSTAAPRVKDRRERKKVQNKEAAARYRVKKRIEEHVLSNEVEGLECEQKKLQDKHDELKAEIKYLKSLMREMLQKKGILK